MKHHWSWQSKSMILALVWMVSVTFLAPATVIAQVSCDWQNLNLLIQP